MEELPFFSLHRSRGGMYTPTLRVLRSVTIWSVTSAGGNDCCSDQNGWLLGDHLGSTSVIANGDGTLSSRLMYKPWGETRTGSSSTTFKFTGQRQESSINLYWYNSRWYDDALGRFIQPDPIVPYPGNPQSFDRYSYVLNSPTNLIDPSGHKACDGEHPEDCNGLGSGVIHYHYLINFVGDWNKKDKEAVYKAVDDVANQLANGSQGELAPDEIFNRVFGGIIFEHVNYSCEEKCWGRTISSKDIRFYQPSTGMLDPRLVVHELGHAFNAHVTNDLGKENSPYTALDATYINNPNFPKKTDEHDGFAGEPFGWQQSEETDSGNEFADMFLGWTYHKWANDLAGATRSSWMNQIDHMVYWILG
jgi:RHS repeat-associated protein